MSNQKIRTARLQKQQIGLDKQPIQYALVKRDGNLNFYFCLYNLDGDFKNGFYFGLLQLHSNYPFAAPKLYFYTPNGRYDVDMPICTSFTNYHQQSWTSAWNVRSLIQGTISFMYSNEASYGCRADLTQQRKKYAQQSLSWNMNNQSFIRLFGQKIKQKIGQFVKLGITIYDKKLLQIFNQKHPELIKKQNIKEANIKKQQTFDKFQPRNIEQNSINFEQNQIIRYKPINEQIQQIRQPFINKDFDFNRQILHDEKQLQQNNKRAKNNQQNAKRQRNKKIIKGLIVTAGVGIPLIWYIIKKIN